tara:strand:+ start:324 stop:566 length:243 start_codon:yes stop_codon:yes gene_type:complete
MSNAHLTEQLTDIILAIIQDSVDARIEQRIADLQEGIDAVASFDINDHRDDIVAMVEEDLDLDDKVTDILSIKTFTTTLD